MADGKWLTELTAVTPLTEAARQALHARLKVVGAYLPLAATDSPSDPEHVHQLRVATRRAVAALRIFESCLSNRGAKRGKQRLRRLRRAAGAARDWDVFTLDLLERLANMQGAQRPGLDYLLGYAAGQRAAAQHYLLDTASEDVAYFETFVLQTVDAVRSPEQESATLQTLARSLLGQLLHELEEKANGDLNDYAHLHQVRIAGKHLRYAMELFAGCFEESFKDNLYPRIEEMQEILGRANDSHVAAERLEAIRVRGRMVCGAVWKVFQPGVAGLLQFHRRRLPRERRAFLKWWDGWKKGEGAALREMLETGKT